MLSSLIPAKQRTEPGADSGALVPSGEFPFFLSRMRDEFDRLFERLASEWPVLEQMAAAGWRWGLDVQEEDDAIVVRAEAPGFEPADFDLQVRDDRLILRAAKKAEKEEKEGKYRKWSQQECYQSVTLPPGVDKDKVEARYHNGVLTVRLPKTAEGKGRRVPIKNA